MGNKPSSYQCINFEDIQRYINQESTVPTLLISTLPDDMYDTVIPKTVHYKEETDVINDVLSKHIETNIFIYGKNTNDETIYNKYHQLKTLGFMNVYLYMGGLFEWLCLQDIYSEENFPLLKKEIDILKYKPQSHLIQHNYQLKY